MILTRPAKWMLRVFVREFCHKSPFPRGKDRLVGTALPIILPYKGETTLVGGTKLEVDLADVLQRRLYFWGKYEHETTNLITRILGKGETFIDVGANIGYYTLIAASLVGENGTVHSFEPIPEIFSLLNGNVQRNKLNNVRLNQTALFDRERELEMFLPHGDNMGTSSFINSGGSESNSIMTKAITLDAYACREAIQRIRLIKIDVEGAELMVLQGMRKLLSTAQAPDLICEASPNWLNIANYSREDLIQFLATFGYQCRQIGPDGLVEPKQNETQTQNLLFTRQSL